MIVLSACLALAIGLTDGIQAAVRVHMVDGRTIEALSFRVEAGVAFVRVGEADTFGFPSSRVARVEDIQELDPRPAPEAQASPLSSAAPAAPEAAASRPPVMMPAQQAPAAQQALPQAGRIDAIDLDAVIRSAAARHHLEPELLAAVIAVESGYRPTAVSPKGARGLMQLMPATAKDLSLKDPFDPAGNIEAGATYLRQLLDRHGDSFVTALAAYNAGTGRVERQKGIPPYRETMQYIDRVLKRYGVATRQGISSLNPSKAPSK